MEKERAQVVMTTVQDDDAMSEASVSSQDILHQVIMDILASEQDGNSSAGWCRGEPITEAGKRRQLWKMLFFILVPLTVLMGVSCYYMTETIKERIESDELRATVKFSVEVGRLIYALQQERDTSVLYLSYIGPETKSLLREKYYRTDIEIQQLSNWPEDLNTGDIYSTRGRFLKHIQTHRMDLSYDEDDLYTEIHFYSDIIDICQKWLLSSILKSQYGGLWKTLVSYYKFIAASSSTGIERALGTTYLARGGFHNPKVYEWYYLEVHRSQAAFKSAVIYINAEDFDILKSLQNTELVKTINKFRDIIHHGRSDAPSLTRATWWFGNMSFFVDNLLKTQVEIASLIMDTLDDRSRARSTNMIVGTILNVFVLAMCPLVIRAVIRLTNSVQMCVLTLANKTKELRGEKKRTDLLLFQMLPKTVVERLKTKKDIEAEFFSSATVFFSDIMDFIDLTGRLSPMQCVMLLNCIYHKYDELIDKYDVYKVETIGDTYMVASGVPKRNGRMHASEIADMALNMVESLDTLPYEIYDWIGGKVNARAGIHTGPCVAGVIGIKLPRYCLFGDTVNTASRMNKHGESGKIHISSETKQYLAKEGVYNIESRGLITVKGKGKMETYWINGRMIARQNKTSTATSSAKQAHIGSSGVLPTDEKSKLAIEMEKLGNYKNVQDPNRPVTAIDMMSSACVFKEVQNIGGSEAKSKPN